MIFSVSLPVIRNIQFDFLTFAVLETDHRAVYYISIVTSVIRDQTRAHCFICKIFKTVV